MDIYLTIFLFLISIFILLADGRRRSLPKNLPPGSLGIPIIGQSLSLLRAMRTNTTDQWLQKRITKYGPMSKLSLFGKPTVFVCGQAANKLVFNTDDTIISNQQTESVKMILGDRNLLELSGSDHKRVRGALVSFLKPESLKMYVGKMDEEVQKHLKLHWHGKQQVTVLPLMKKLTFNIMCSLIFSLGKGTKRDELLECFHTMIDGIWSIPIKFPFTRYSLSLKASKKVQEILKEVLSEKRIELEQKGSSAHQDLITRLLSFRNEVGEEELSENEILHNVMIVMVAGYDTSSILITFIIRLLANNPIVYAAVLQEQEEIAKNKPPGEPLKWEDLVKMKYTWRVALETLRMIPPVFGGFRKALKDIEFGGYLIPKGWQIFWATPMTQMDETIFHEPTRFDPGRFENQSSIPPYCFAAFGGGHRICPGSEFARIETLVTIHYLITRFTWKLCADDKFIRDPTPEPTKGLPIQIVPKI